MKHIVNFIVTKNKVHYEKHVLSSGVYTEMMPFGDTDTIVSFEEADYASLPYGSVFVPFNPYRKWAFEEPSCFLVKKEFGNFYLTGNDELPLGVEREVYERVLAVV